MDSFISCHIMYCNKMAKNQFIAKLCSLKNTNNTKKISQQLYIKNKINSFTLNEISENKLKDKNEIKSDFDGHGREREREIFFQF
jgi:hypothetical protein